VIFHVLNLLPACSPAEINPTEQMPLDKPASFAVRRCAATKWLAVFGCMKE